MTFVIIFYNAQLIYCWESLYLTIKNEFQVVAQGNGFFGFDFELHGDMTQFAAFFFGHFSVEWLCWRYNLLLLCFLFSVGAFAKDTVCCCFVFYFQLIGCSLMSSPCTTLFASWLYGYCYTVCDYIEFCLKPRRSFCCTPVSWANNWVSVIVIVHCNFLHQLHFAM